MEKILLDTNFLMIPGQFRLDIFREIKKIAEFNYKVYILDLSLEELKKIALKGSGKDKKAAKLALELVKTQHIKIIPTKTKELEGLYADDIIVRLADDYIIGTLDKELKKRLSGKRLIILRQKKYLELR